MRHCICTIGSIEYGQHMINKTAIRHILIRCVPSSLYPAIRKFINSPKIVELTKKFGINFYTPTWNTVSKGQFKGIKLFFDTTNGVWEKEMLNGLYDKYFYDYLKKESLRGRIFFDIGAHIGYSTLTFASLVGSNGKVIAFEPNTYNYERLLLHVQENVSLQKRIHCENIAISNENGVHDFVFSTNIEDGTSSGSFLSSAHTILEKHSYEDQLGFKKAKVQTQSLDTYIKNAALIPDYVKIDVEGAEDQVIEGAKKLLQSKTTTFFIELHSIFSAYKVTQTLTSYHYTITLLHQENDGRCFIVAKR